MKKSNEFDKPDYKKAVETRSGDSRYPAPGDAEKRNESSRKLGRALSIRQVAEMLGCSVWTVRQTFIREGMPLFRAGNRGRIVFFEQQVVAWIEKRQQGEKD